MFDVEQVVSHLLGLFLEVLGIAIAHLRPAGDARPHRAAEDVVGDGIPKQREVRFRVRTRTYEVHIPTNDVDQLRQLVETEPPKPSTHRRDPLEIVTRPLRRGLSRRLHGAELDDVEWASSPPKSLL